MALLPETRGKVVTCARLLFILALNAPINSLVCGLSLVANAVLVVSHDRR